MAAIAQAPVVSDPVPTKKARSRKALKPKDSSANEANILAAAVSESSPVLPPPDDSIEKENHESLSKNKKKTKKGAAKLKQTPELSLEKELQAMQEKLQQLTLEKAQTEEMLKEKDEILKKKEEEEEKLHLELKKLQKAKEFKPTFSINSLKEKEKEKKKGNYSIKKPSPAYVLWCKDQWTEMKKSNPEADFKEVSILLGAKWKNVKAEEKKPYEEKYKAEKEAYLKIVGNEKREHEAMKLLEEEQKQKTAMELLEQYTQFVQETENANKKKSKKEKDESKPKQPMSAFFLFSKEKRGLLGENKNAVEAAKVAGEEWRNMTAAQKAPYEEMASQNKEQYLEEMKVYKQTKAEEAANLEKEEEVLMKLQKQEAMQLLKKKEKTQILIKKTKENKKKEKKKSDPNKPKRPASSFILFSKEERKNVLEEHPEINNMAVNAHISVKWKELSEEEKQKWNAKAAVAMEAYKKEVEAYNQSAATDNQSAAAESSEGSN